MIVDRFLNLLLCHGNACIGVTNDNWTNPNSNDQVSWWRSRIKGNNLSFVQVAVGATDKALSFCASQLLKIALEASNGSFGKFWVISAC